MNSVLFKRHLCWRQTCLMIGLLLSAAIGHCETCRGDEPQRVRGDLLLIVGTPGTEEYHERFRQWGEKWIAAAAAGHLQVTSLGLKTEEAATLDRIREKISGLVDEKQTPLWIVLIGHGTFDGQSAKFNLPGTDLDPEMLEECLSPMSRPVAIIQCASASAPFLQTLAAPGRVVITATNSGNEVNFSYFGQYLALAITHPAADLDKDEQISLLEAFLYATQQTEQFYHGEGRLASEHAVMDDNGDARSVSAEGFDGLRPVRRQDRQHLLPDGTVAHQWILVPNAVDATLSPEVIAARNEIELQISALQLAKPEMQAEEYYTALELLFVQLARLMLTPEQTTP